MYTDLCMLHTRTVTVLSTVTLTLNYIRYGKQLENTFNLEILVIHTLYAHNKMKAVFCGVGQYFDLRDNHILILSQFMSTYFFSVGLVGYSLPN